MAKRDWFRSVRNKGTSAFTYQHLLTADRPPEVDEACVRHPDETVFLTAEQVREGLRLIVKCERKERDRLKGKEFVSNRMRASRVQNAKEQAAHNAALLAEPIPVLTVKPVERKGKWSSVAKRKGKSSVREEQYTQIGGNTHGRSWASVRLDKKT
jgi:hypothetical protein